MEPQTYAVTPERDGAFWFVRVPGVGATQARRLDQVGPMVRDLVSLVLEVPPDSFDVVVRPPALEPETLALIEEAIASRIAAQDLQVRASARLRQVAVELTGSGLTIRDTGRLLGVSHQRIAQLVNEARRQQTAG